MTYTAKCPVCSTNIEYGEEWIGRHYKCNCGVTISLAGPGEKKLDVVPPDVLEMIKEREARKSIRVEPSLEIAFGWTWRVLVSLFLIGMILSVVGFCVWQMAHWSL